MPFAAAAAAAFWGLTADFSLHSHTVHRCRDACRSRRGLAARTGGPRQRTVEPDCTELRAVYQRLQKALEVCTAEPDAEALVAFLARRGAAEEELPQSPTGPRFSDSLLSASWRSAQAQSFLEAFIEAEKEARAAAARDFSPLFRSKLAREAPCSTRAFRSRCAQPLRTLRRCMALRVRLCAGGDGYFGSC